MTHETKQFKAWSVILARAAMKHQDKTFRELVHEKIIPSWAEYFLKHKR